MRLQGLIRRKGAKSGATALEFALLSPVFFLLMFAIIQTGCIYIGEAWLSYATNDMARMIRTGQVQLQSIDRATFRTMMCDKIDGFLDCNTNLQIDVQKYPTFTAVNFSPPLDANGNLNTMNNYDPGTNCEVVLVRNFYKYEIPMPIFTPFLVNMADDSRLLSSAAAFRNEPFTAATNGC